MNIGVLGAGTWGTALSRMLCRDGNNVTVWSAIEKEVDDLNENRVHPNLDNMVIPDEVVFTKNIQDACTGMDMVLIVVPSVFVRSTAAKAKEYIDENTVVVNLSKGIEESTLMTMTDVIADELGRENGIVALSGPTHAEEVAKDMPTTIVSASRDMAAAKLVQKTFSNDFMRVYTNSDIVGVELCGAMKNIVALATGISAGLGNGDNAKAALITRGMAEIARLGMAMGCEASTFYGLAGVGDLIVTATSSHSRNNHAGFLLGKGYTPEQAKKEVGMVVEGINALPAAVKLSEKYGVEMPIISAVNDIVHNGIVPSDVADNIMNRALKRESI